MFSRTKSVLNSKLLQCLVTCVLTDYSWTLCILGAVPNVSMIEKPL